MKAGSVIVDMAGEAGGNCELTEPGETIVRHDVKILSPLNLPAGMPEHSSQLFARNVQALLELFVGEDGNLHLDADGSRFLALSEDPDLVGLLSDGDPMGAPIRVQPRDGVNHASLG